ncbi:ACP S-malonyltransferase [Pseudomarimonas arenosa]|uniref:[acyl-carrier-protein] S-malonyltransferase n=1 Tax=Pseudomarimonas arenosa TaxID=2774145 RepID=A0AAW3ZIJ4_9GAMM|nr:ACP S-malonyltransferase [Pseudomarimonas arenosa]MBD8525900.1 ACP S-malonyltransferase [Pseudomarimonas arenosa]
MKTYMFPGQGSQARGMGGDLFDEFPELTAKADKLLGYSIKELCLEDPRRELNNTQFTQPALYVVNALSYYKRIQDTGETPDYLAGHSLGEFNALLAAECFSFETGLKLVKKRGELMSAATEGAMAAIVNASREQVEDVLKENGLSHVDIANHNTPQQIVISGPTADIAACQEIFQFDRVMYVPLNTSGAFHSRLMMPARQKFEAFLKKRKFSKPKIPVIANLTAKPYPNAAVVEYLSKQISSTVQWSDTIHYLMSLSDAMEFVEIGHGNVLAKMILKIKQIAAQEVAEQAPQAPAPAQAEEKPETRNVRAVDAVAPTSASAANDAGNARGESNDSARTDRFALAEQKVAAWNRRHPVGTRVKSLVEHGALVTRTPAVLLFGHRAAVYMEGFNGYFDLDELSLDDSLDQQSAA